MKKILLVNPPHTAIGSSIPREQLPPLGLLSVGGPLIDTGYDVALLDAEFGPMTVQAVISAPLQAGEERTVIETDTAKWDYKHQVLATTRVPPWRVLLWGANAGALPSPSKLSRRTTDSS